MPGVARRPSNLEINVRRKKIIMLHAFLKKIRVEPMSKPQGLKIAYASVDGSGFSF